MADLASIVDEHGTLMMEKEAQGPTSGMVRMLSLSQYSDLANPEEVGIDEIEEQLTSLRENILSWESDDQSMIWDERAEEAFEYLRVVTEVIELDVVLQRLRTSNGEEKENELLTCTQSTLQIAMARLEEEFVYLLDHERSNVKPKGGSFRSAEDCAADNFSSSSFDEESVDGRSACTTGRRQEDGEIDLIDPRVVHDLNSIANVMFLCKYDKECCQAYIGARRDALDEAFSVLGMEKFSIEEVLKMEWNALSSAMKMWNQALREFVNVFLAGERRLCDLIFGELCRSVRESCFVEATKSAVIRLLSFAEATAISPPKPERLFQILDMYETLSDCLVRVEYFFSEDYGSGILIEFQQVLTQLGEAVIGTIKAFKHAIQANTSTTAFPGGGVHHLTKYVMNYIRTLPAYSETLCSILKAQQQANGQNLSSSSDDGVVGSSNPLSSVLAQHLQSVTSSLESNLDAKSHLYNDSALKNIFMMNNIRYMVQKVKNSDLRKFLGDGWIRLHNVKFQQYATNYQRASWTPVLSFLRDEGFSNSSSPSRSELKDRFRGFNLAFEELYKAQTGWSVPDHGLRDDLMISISLTLLQAYRMFMGRHARILDGERHRDRYIKYYPDDLEEYLLDLFAGSQKSLPNPRRR